jgi:hypothetical protein
MHETPWILPVPVFRILRRLGVRCDFTFPSHVHDMGREFWERLKMSIGCSDLVRLVHSGTSPVETRLAQDPVRTFAAYLLKTPAMIAPRAWNYVGGWEVLFERIDSPS